ncbi:glycosyl hydrolase family 28 protein [uncultured Sunxiuqinia sp.]|uniref:glycoside hydrolase family 28 protein n=1 Tax=uncultured Sunxiuqinia sp. TaxID=1573825 RepID=UPI002AA777FB|nr:glycosyl hydrolase family 28 protein [uncultured Sunxiuqinia sp.]
MKNLTIICLLLLTTIAIQAKDVNVLEVGATADGKTLNTDIIQKAIDQCSESGGGEIVFPTGKYLTGSIILKSGVHLHLKHGATLLGSTNIEDYLSIQPDYVALRTLKETKQLIFAEGQHNIGIVGDGTIDGQGEVFIRIGNDEGIRRPHGIQLINCKNVKIEGVFMTNSGAWMQHYLACDNVQIRGIRVYNHCNYNNDGIDIDGCHDVVISDCIVDSDDDGICLKSTSPRSCKNVTINNCVVHSHCNSLKLGTETTGGFQNIQITNCVVSPSEKETTYYGTAIGQSAISIEMVDGGALDQVSIDRISIMETGCPIFVRLGNRARKHTPEAPQPQIGELKNVSITNITATTTSKTTSNITGIAGSYAERIFLGNILITNLSNGTEEDKATIVPEKDAAYPTAAMFGTVLPASGFYVRHVANFTVDNVRITTSNKELRPVFVLDDVIKADIFYPQVRSKATLELIDEKNCAEIRVVR